jgi:SAM-dependent methyltransferase
VQGPVSQSAGPSDENTALAQPDAGSPPAQPLHPAFEAILEQYRVGENAYLAGHVPRYRETFHHMPHGRFLRGGEYGSAIEIGATYVMAQALLEICGFTSVDVTDFSRGERNSTSQVRLRNGRTVRAMNVDLEHDRLLADDESYDLALCFEVIEHMEIDPMFMLSEVNRVLRPGGLVYLSTPNVCSGRNVWKILNGFAPHFFMKYSRTRSYHRHNIELAPHQLVALLKAAGFEIAKMWSKDCFEPTMPEALDLLERNGFRTDMRGDNLFVIGRKIGPVAERFPSAMYF